MAIEGFLSAALREWSYDHYSVAMACACIAADATAKAESGRVKNRNEVQFSNFIDSKLDIITVVGFGGAIQAAPGSRISVRDPLNSSSTSELP